MEVIAVIQKKGTTYEHGEDIEDWYNDLLVAPVVTFVYGTIFQFPHPPTPSYMVQIQGYIRSMSKGFSLAGGGRIQKIQI